MGRFNRKLWLNSNGKSILTINRTATLNLCQFWCEFRWRSNHFISFCANFMQISKPRLRNRPIVMQIVIDSAETENGGSEIVHKISNLMPVSSAQRENLPIFMQIAKMGKLKLPLLQFRGKYANFMQMNLPRNMQIFQPSLEKKNQNQNFTAVWRMSMQLALWWWQGVDMQMRCKWDWPAFSCRTYTHRLIQDRCDEIW